MVRFPDLVQVVGENLLAHRLRAALTILGITIGIAAVIAVVAIGQGGQAVIISQLESLGSSRYFEVTVDVMRGEAPTADTFRMQDAALIKELSPAVERMAPLSYASMIDVRRPHSGGKPLLSQLYGTTPDLIYALNMKVEKGRFLSDADVNAHARVAVLDADLAKELFADVDPLGKQIFIQGIPATVVGVMQKPPSSIMSMMNLKGVYVPITFAQ
ncbi:MAG: ABC transporter permease, partial [Desulfofundulus sp.]